MQFDKRQQVVAINKKTGLPVLGWGNRGNISSGELIKTPIIFTVEKVDLQDETVKLYNSVVLFKIEDQKPSAYALARCYEPTESWWYNKEILALDTYLADAYKYMIEIPLGEKLCFLIPS